MVRSKALPKKLTEKTKKRRTIVAKIGPKKKPSASNVKKPRYRPGMYLLFRLSLMRYFIVEWKLMSI